MKACTVDILVAVGCLIIGPNIFASPGRIDPSFSAEIDGGNMSVNGIAIQEDGKIVVAGAFTHSSGQFRRGLVRLLSTGAVESDASFNIGTGTGNNPVNTDPYGTVVLCASVQEDQRILVGGYFPSFNGRTRNRIARLESFGSVEATTSFRIGTGVTGPAPWGGHVRSIAVQKDGKIIVVGDITGFSGRPMSGIVRLNPDGSLEDSETFKVEVSGETGIPDCVAVQEDGKILIGGSFTRINGVAVNYLARLNVDGSVESKSTFNPGTGPNRPVNAISIQPDGKIILGGRFTEINGVSRRYLARLDGSGGLDTESEFNIGSGPNDKVETICLQSNGKILIGGIFTTFNGQQRKRIARINSDGKLDEIGMFDLSNGPDIGFNRKINGIALQADGKVLITGESETINNVRTNRIVRLLNDPANQSLIHTSKSKIEWIRSGSSPEISYSVFAKSVDGGSTWKSIGFGNRTSRGWELVGQDLDGTELVKAIGRTYGGLFNGSSGVVAAQARFDPTPNIQLDISESNTLVSVTDGIDFGPIPTGTKATKTIKVSNTGTNELLNIEAKLSDSALPICFRISGEAPSNRLSVGDSTFVNIEFTPLTDLEAKASLEITSNDPDESSITIDLVGRRATPLEAWKIHYFSQASNNGISSDLGDPDFDGSPNILEYGTMTNPLLNSTVPMTVDLIENSIIITYTRRKSSVGELEFVREFADSVQGPWSRVGGLSESVIGESGDTQVVQNVTPAGGSGRRFVRLRVSKR